MAKILLLSTLDTKGKEAAYLAGRIAACGCEPLVMDLSMRHGEERAAGIPPEKVAAAGGLNWEEVTSSQDRARITEFMIKGAKQLAKDLLEEGRVQGIMGLGGSTGSLMATEVMRVLPFGLPKLMVSSTAALPGLSTRYIDTGDIALFHTVVEITGLSDLLKNLLDRAALSICARRHIDTSMSLAATIINSASSSTIMTMYGSFSGPASLGPAFTLPERIRRL